MKLLLRTVLLLLAAVDSCQAGATSSALSALKSLDYRYFVAGGTCAAISHGITTPVDVVKTRIQADPAKYNRGMLAATSDIIKTDGVGILLGGLGPTVAGYGIEGAMKFGVYEVMKPVFAAILSKGSESGNNAMAYLFASVVAGAVAAVLLCPMESTRIRIVTDPAYAGKGLLTGLPKLMRDEGLWSTFAGLWAMLAKQVPYTLGKQVSFDVFAQILYSYFHSIQEKMSLMDGQIKWAVSVLAAFAASIVACIFSQPGDMILTETYRPKKKTVKGAPADDRSFVDVIRAIYATNGFATFFTGTGARIVHVGLIITSQLVIYDIVKQLLGLPATGSH
jgi:solute carrier family 25 (mitochondrial phosphate transporter), member 3